MENLPLTLWIDLKKRELESVDKSLDAENRNRRRSEFILILICVIAFIYVYPANKIDSDFIIEIPSISLKLPLQAALIGFPTLIASIYLILMNSAIRQSRLKIISVKINISLKKVTKSGMIPIEDEEPKSSSGVLSLLLLPSPIQMSNYGDNIISTVGNYIVKWFVGLVFNLFPYLTSLLITFKTLELISNRYIFIWDIICTSVMLMAFISTFFSYLSSKKYKSYESAV